MFQHDVASIPPERDVEYAIDLTVGSISVSKKLYQLMLAEKLELKQKIQEDIRQEIHTTQFLIMECTSALRK